MTAALPFKFHQLTSDPILFWSRLHDSIDSIYRPSCFIIDLHHKTQMSSALVTLGKRAREADSDVKDDFLSEEDEKTPDAIHRNEPRRKRRLRAESIIAQGFVEKPTNTLDGKGYTLIVDFASINDPECPAAPYIIKTAKLTQLMVEFLLFVNFPESNKENEANKEETMNLEYFMRDHVFAVKGKESVAKKRLPRLLDVITQERVPQDKVVTNPDFVFFGALPIDSDESSDDSENEDSDESGDESEDEAQLDESSNESKECQECKAEEEEWQRNAKKKTECKEEDT